MPETSVKDQLKKLVELQKLDGEIYEKKRELKEKPAQVEELKEQFEGKKTTLNGLEEKSKEIQVQRKEIELELQTKEGEISKANASLNEIKTNKEYTAKLTEIESIKADMSKAEEKILKSYDESDTVAAEIEKEKGNVAEEEKKYLALKKEVDDEVKVIEDRIKVLEGQRKQLEPEIDSNHVKRYERILENKDGSGIVPVEGTACGGCFMNVTAQIINQIKMGEDIVQCEFCGRILYIEDDL